MSKRQSIQEFIKIRRSDLSNSRKIDNSSVLNQTNISTNSSLNNLMGLINDSYQTFQKEPPKSKKLYRLRKIIFQYLYKYSFRQIQFNDNIKNMINIQLQEVQSAKNDLLQHRRQTEALQEKTKELEILIESLTKKVEALTKKEVKNTKLINNYRNFLIELDTRIYALQEKTDILTLNTNITKHAAKGGLLYSRFFSQFGEDRWIVSNIDLTKKGFFVDVGAADGVTFSNTYYFEKLGWSGICFEPDPRNFELAQNFRKDILPYAVSTKNGTVDFYLSTVAPDWSGLKDNNHGSEITKVKAVTLGYILEKSKVKNIDLLSIDTEGTELDVWESFDYKKYKPKVVIIEYNSQGEEDDVIIRTFKKLPYKLVHTTYSNYIFKFKE